MEAGGWMRAVEYDRAGPPSVLEVRRVRVPAPGRGEVLVRVRAAALNPKDVIVRRGRFRLLAGGFPRRVGWDWAGEVVALGPGVRGLREGQRLFGMVQAWSAGACADGLVVRPAECAVAPPSLSFEEAASIPLAALTALQALRDLACVRPGDRVLLLGASGGVGVHAIQLARALGAHVTTTSSARGLALCASLGAHEALDREVVDPLRSGARWRAIVDVFGSRRFAEARASLDPGGVFVGTVPRPGAAVDAALAVAAGRRARLVVVRARAEDLAFLAGEVEAGRLRPVLERVFPLEEVAAAQALVETKRCRGKVVVRLDP
jgi:NADPH:quinone reductase-like Zn-dependent oxidoreductase